MAEYIDREKLLENLTIECDNCDDFCSDCFLSDYLEIVKKMPTIVPESPWHDASTPPPITDVKEWDDEHGHHRYATSDKVWIYCETGQMMYGKYDEVGGYFADNGLYIGRWYGLRVTHWMPLPEAPKGVA